MLDKDQFLSTLRHEVAVIKHLATKIPEGQLGWRPTPPQRSTEELLRYLTLCAHLAAVGMVNGNWDHVQEMNAEADEVTPETFADAMDRQMTRLEELVATLSEDDLSSRDANLPWGQPVKLGEALVRTALESFVAYRMQLFLHAKESGNPDIGTIDCWLGVDPQQPTST